MKMITFVVIITGIIILLNAGGIQTNSGALIGNGTVVYNFVNSSAINRGANETSVDSGLGSFKSSGFWTKLKSILGLSIFVGLAAGLITGTPPTSIIKGSLVSLFGGAFLYDTLGLYLKLYSYGVIWVRWVAVAIFVPLVLAFFITLVSWWEGSDN